MNKRIRNKKVKASIKGYKNFFYVSNVLNKQVWEWTTTIYKIPQELKEYNERN